jgi:transcriptional activator SPT7
MTLINSRKEEGPEYPPPRPFLPLSNSNWQNQLPNLFHSFFKARIDGGQGLQDDGFDHSHSQIGSLVQIVVKAPPMAKKKVEVEKKKKVAKVVYVPSCPFSLPSLEELTDSVPGPGKGNWSKSPSFFLVLLYSRHTLIISPTIERRKRTKSRGKEGLYSHES